MSKDRIVRGVRFVVGCLLAVLGASVGLPVFAVALTTEKPVTMWDKVDSRLAGATPAAQMTFRVIKTWCMQHLKGINLQLVDVANLGAFQLGVTGPLRVYAVYAKKQATATRAFVGLFDDVLNDATAANERLVIGLAEASKEALVFYPDGLPLAAGLVAGGYTTAGGFNGTTLSTSGDNMNGFFLVG
jgi:hypothetical protein